MKRLYTALSVLLVLSGASVFAEDIEGDISTRYPHLRFQYERDDEDLGSLTPEISPNRTLKDAAFWRHVREVANHEQSGQSVPFYEIVQRYLEGVGMETQAFSQCNRSLMEAGVRKIAEARREMEAQLEQERLNLQAMQLELSLHEFEVQTFNRKHELSSENSFDENLHWLLDPDSPPLLSYIPGVPAYGQEGAFMLATGTELTAPLAQTAITGGEVRIVGISNMMDRTGDTMGRVPSLLPASRAGNLAGTAIKGASTAFSWISSLVNVAQLGYISGKTWETWSLMENMLAKKELIAIYERKVIPSMEYVLGNMRNDETRYPRDFEERCARRSACSDQGGVLRNNNPRFERNTPR